MKFFLVFIVLLCLSSVTHGAPDYAALAQLAARSQSAVIDLQNGTYTDVVSPAGQAVDTFFLDISGVPSNVVDDYLLFVSINVSLPDLGSYVGVVFTTSYVSIGAFDLDPDQNRSSIGGIFCWSPSPGDLGPPSGYFIVLVHPLALDGANNNPGSPSYAPVSYQIIAALVTRALTLDVPQTDAVPLPLVYWYFDFQGDPRAAPLEITVDSLLPQSAGPPKTIALYYGCPGRLTAGTLIPPEYIATFYDKVRITVSKAGGEGLKQGRWFIGVQKDRSDQLVFKTSYGMPLSDYPSRYGLTFLFFILVCPAICAVTLALIWSVQPSVSRKWSVPPESAEALRSSEWSDESSGSSASDLEIDENGGDHEAGASARRQYETIKGEDYFGSPESSRETMRDDAPLLNSIPSSSSSSSSSLPSQSSITTTTTTTTTSTSTLHHRTIPSDLHYQTMSAYSPTNSTGHYPSSSSSSSSSSETTKPNHFSEMTVIVGLVFFTPAIQILIEQLLLQADTGDQDTCYYNDLCQRPIYSSGLLIYAFNNVYSNVGYLVAGFTVMLYIWLLRYKLQHLPKFMPNNYPILWAMCLCLVFIGINSGIYHLCPSRIGFQVDSAMMLGFALLSLGDIWRRYFSPNLHGWQVYMILAALLLVNYVGTIIDTYPTLSDRKAPKYWFRGVLSLAVVGAAAAFLAWIWCFRKQQLYRKTNTLLTLLFMAPIIGLLWWDIDSDLSQTLLGIFIFLYAISVAADFSAQIGVGLFIEHGRLPRVCRWCPQGRHSCFKDRSVYRRLRTGLLIVWLFCGWAVCGLTAVYYFTIKSDTNKDLSPAASRNLNSPCIIADYYSTHDLWHGLSALWLLFQLLINAHIGHGLKSSPAFGY